MFLQKFPTPFSPGLIGFTVTRCNCSAGLLIRCYQPCFCKVVTYKFLFSIAVGQTFSLHWLLFILAEFMCSPSRILERSTCGFTCQTEGGLDLPWEVFAVSLQSIQKGGYLGTIFFQFKNLAWKYKSAKKQCSEEQKVWPSQALYFTSFGGQSNCKE